MLKEFVDQLLIFKGPKKEKKEWNFISKGDIPFSVNFSCRA